MSIAFGFSCQVSAAATAALESRGVLETKVFVMILSKIIRL